MMIKWEAQIWANDVKPMKIDRETESSVWVDGKRRAKMSEYACYFDKWEDAKGHLVEIAQENVDKYRRYLDQRKSKLDAAMGLKKPENEQ